MPLPHARSNVKGRRSKGFAFDSRLSTFDLRPTRRYLTLVLLAIGGCGDNVTPPSRQTFVGADATPLSCAPNLDGKLESNELQAVVGTPVDYLINPAGRERTVDVAGRLEGGSRVFGFDVDFADDQKLSVAASSVAGKWYSASFPTGEFVTGVDAAGTIEGVYRHEDSGLFLLGLVSKTETDKTLLVYDQPIAIVRFPLTVGTKWVAVGTVTNGTVRGLPYAGKDTYEIEDDSVGKLVLHDFTFQQVHRLRTRVTVSPSAGAVTTRRQVSFFAECFGEVVRVVSKNEEPNADFTVATELRRLGQ
jgi:hypothetical protein